MPVKFVKGKKKSAPVDEGQADWVGSEPADSGLPTAQQKSYETVHHADKTVTHKNTQKPVVSKTPLCVVSMSGGQTINIGNYNSVRFEVGLSMPCQAAEVEGTYEFIKNWLDMRLLELQKEVKPATE